MRNPLKSQDVRSAALGCAVSAAGLAAARASRRRAARRPLKREVATAMTTDPVTVSVSTPLSRAAEALASAEVGSLPVCDDHGHLIGMVTDRDIVVRAIAQCEDPERTSVSEFVTPDVVTVAPLDTLEDAASLMASAAVRRLPVILDDRVVGMVSESDLARSVAPSRVGTLERQLARRPGDRTSGSWLLRRAHGRR